GLAFRFAMSHGFEDAYVARVESLLRANGGAPAWSMHGHVPREADLISAFQSGELPEITAFPHDLSPDVVVMQGGYLTRWGQTFGSDGGGLTIATPHGM